VSNTSTKAKIIKRWHTPPSHCLNVNMLWTMSLVTGQKWRHNTLQTVHVYQCAKFGDNISNGGRVIAIFRFSKWRPAAILDFVVAQKWHQWTLRGVHGHQLTKFGEDIWNSGGWVMAIFLFLKWRPAATLDFVKVKSGVTAGCGLSVSTTMPNLVTISHTRSSYCNFAFFKMAADRHLGFGPTDL